MGGACFSRKHELNDRIDRLIHTRASGLNETHNNMNEFGEIGEYHVLLYMI